MSSKAMFIVFLAVSCVLGVLTSPFTNAILTEPNNGLPSTQAPIPQDFTTENGGQNAGESPGVGYKFSQEADAWLRLHTTPASWTDADQRCRLEGSVLATPTTKALMQAMLTMMALDKLTSNDSVFTAVSATTSNDDEFMFDKGESNVEYCVVLTGEGKVDYESCASERAFFCLKTPRQCPTGYEWSPRTSSCYKFYRVAKTWHKAAKTCRDDGAHLAIINSEIEHQELKDIFESYPMYTIVGGNNNIVAIIGFWKWDSRHGEWMTIHGETLAEAGFDKWSRDPTQPDNFSGNEYCGSILRDGLLNDVPCNEKPFAFICEMNP